MEAERVPLFGGAARGFVAGVAATGAMSLLMLAAGRLGLMGEQPPDRITGHVLRRLWPFRSEEETDLAASAAHVAFGGGAGIVFAVLRRLAPLRLPGAGVGFALLVWLVSYAGVIPALGIMPRPDRDRPGRAPTMVAAHVLYGLVLERLTAALSAHQGRDQRRRHGETG